MLRSSMLRAPAALLAVALAIAGLATTDAAARPARPSPGAASAGDPLFPGLGNGGYRVRHYDLDLRYATPASVQTVPGIVTVDARSTQALSRFDLDFNGDAVSWVTVDGHLAGFRREGEELVVDPRRPIRDGRRFVVRVGFASGPQTVSPEESGDLNAILAKAWFATPSGSITAAQPSFAHRIFPSNDVPSDPATFTIRASTPATSTFVANGERTGRLTVGDRTLWRYDEREPMATELIQLGFGTLTVRTRAPEDGVRLRDVAPSTQIDALEPALVRERDHLDWMTGKVGRYPFSIYGSFASDATFPFALEDQTLSLYPSLLFLPQPGSVRGDPRYFEPIMVHELAHQWYGDRVTPFRWSDVWLNEGHATWYEWEYAQERGDPAFYLEGGSFEAQVRTAYERGNQLRATFGPVAAPAHGADDVASLFSPNVYEGGALVLYALRQVVGDATFRAIERAWPRVFGGGPASTADFIAFASRLAHRDLSAFLRDWLYGSTIPPMPGHPDWSAVPAAGALAAARVTSGAPLLAHR